MSCRPLYIKITNLKTGVVLNNFDIVSNLNEYLVSNFPTNDNSRFFGSGVNLQSGMTFSVPATASSFTFTTNRISATWSRCNDAFAEITSYDTDLSSLSSSSWTFVVNSSSSAVESSKWCLVTAHLGASFSTISTSNLTGTQLLYSNSVVDTYTGKTLHLNIWMGNDAAGTTGSFTINYVAPVEFKSSQFFTVWARPVNQSNGWTTGKTVNLEIGTATTGTSRTSGNNSISSNIYDCVVGVAVNCGNNSNYTRDSDTTNGIWSDPSTVGVGATLDGVSIMLQDKTVNGNSIQTYNPSFSNSTAITTILRFYLTS